MRPADGFVRRDGARLTLGVNTYRVAGACCYYFAFLSTGEQIRILDLTAAFGMNTLRIWAFHDFPGRSGERVRPGPADVCFRFFDPAVAAPEPRDGPYGLERLDLAVHLAGERGVRLILTLTNYHGDYGGLPQYGRWFGVNAPDDVYRDADLNAALREGMAAVVMRRNTINGLPYADDPAILAWEIANEPRSSSPPALITEWLGAMSGFLRGMIPKQLIAAGDEGFFAPGPRGSRSRFGDANGVDAEAILRLPDIDIGTFHLYPSQWAPAADPVAWGQMWIAEHARLGRRVGKPMLLEEFGLPNTPERDFAYFAWLEMIENLDLCGDLVWMLGLPGLGDEYLLAGANAAPAIAQHARRRSISSVRRVPREGE